jgi:hypothetical protein
MLSRFYTAHYSVPPEPGHLSFLHSSSALNVPLNLLLIILPIVIAIGIARCRKPPLSNQGREPEWSELERQREILERIWRIPARK